MKYRLVSQEDSMGCAVACVASILNVSYKESLKIFGIKKADKPNFYCNDITAILNRKGLNYTYGKFIEKTKKFAKKEGTIIFLRRSKKFPFGHFILKTKKGWMNPWINLPKNPSKAGFQKRLPDLAQWIIYQK